MSCSISLKCGRTVTRLIQSNKYVFLPRCHSSSPASSNPTEPPPPPPPIHQSQFPLATVLEKMASLNNPTIYSNMANIKDIGQYLISKNIPLEKVIRLFSVNPDLCQYPRRNWETVVDYLSGNEVPNKVIVQVLVKVPQILDRSVDDLENSFDCLRRRGFNNRAIYKLYYQAPVLLAVEAAKVDRQFVSLMSVFTRKDLLRLVPKCCNVLTEEWSDLEAKLRYIVHVMGVEQPQVVSSLALSHTLHHIRLRHQFLYRAGLYKKVRPKKKVTNPRLSLITDTPTKELVEKVVGIRMQEFFVFERLLLQEGPERGLELEDDGTLQSDSEEDTESDTD